MNNKEVIFNTLGSAFSGAVSRGITHPMDTLKARLQVRSNKGNINGSGMSLTSFAREIIQKEGMKGLYNGAGVSVVSFECAR